MNIFGVHLDRQATMPNVQHIIKEIKHHGREAVFFNINAADAIKRNETLDEIKETVSGPGHTVKVLIHSLAFGTLKPFIAKKPDDAHHAGPDGDDGGRDGAQSCVLDPGTDPSRPDEDGAGGSSRMTSSGGHTVLPVLWRRLRGKVRAGVPHPPARDGARAALGSRPTP